MVEVAEPSSVVLVGLVGHVELVGHVGHVELVGRHVLHQAAVPVPVAEDTACMSYSR